jgi:hypothetical protein
MTSTAAAPGVENLILSINMETRVSASLDATFAALLDQLGPGGDTPEGKPMPLKLEAWPGGRWFRDLGDGNGHYWGTVQAIKRPTLLEICGPLFMSQAVISNVQYRLSEVEGGTLITFHHFALGAIPDDVRQNIGKGWTHISGRVRARAEAKH